MDYYHIWCNLKDSSKDMQFVNSLHKYLGFLQTRKQLAGYRITRRKLGFGPPELGEFHIILEFEKLSQLEDAFQLVAARSGDVEQHHQAIYSAVTDFRSALYRDFPDPDRTS